MKRVVNRVLGSTGLMLSKVATVNQLHMRLATAEARAADAESRAIRKDIEARKAADKAAGKKAKANVLLVITASSQVNNVQLLFENTSFLAHYHPIIVSYIGGVRAGLGKYCQRQKVTLLDHRLESITKASPDDQFNRYRWWESYRSENPLTHDTRYPFWTGLKLDKQVDLQKIGSEVRFQNEMRNAFLRGLNALTVRLVIVFEDNAESETSIWISAANILGLASVIIPFTIADATEPAEAHLSDPLFHVSGSKYNEWIAPVCPQWVIHYKGVDLVRRPGISAIASEWLGFAPPNPWILNTTFATAIAVESRAMKEHYQRAGIPDPKLVTTGSLSDDVLFKSQRARVDRASTTKIMLCAFPPNQLTAIRPGIEFTSYADLVKFWINALNSHAGWELVVRPHPFMSDSEIDLLKSHGASISMEHTASLIPYCNLYIASVSSTIRWAISVGKPVLNYDVFAYCYRDFDNVKSVVTVSNKQRFTEAIDRLTADETYLSDLTALAERESHRWAELDGKSGDRILRLFSELIEGVPDASNEALLRGPTFARGSATP
jgi:hypothetical protein